MPLNFENVSNQQEKVAKIIMAGESCCGAICIIAYLCWALASICKSVQKVISIINSNAEWVPFFAAVLHFKVINQIPKLEIREVQTNPFLKGLMKDKSSKRFQHRWSKMWKWSYFCYIGWKNIFEIFMTHTEDDNLKKGINCFQ